LLKASPSVGSWPITAEYATGKLIGRAFARMGSNQHEVVTHGALTEPSGSNPGSRKRIDIRGLGKIRMP